MSRAAFLVAIVLCLGITILAGVGHGNPPGPGSDAAADRLAAYRADLSLLVEQLPRLHVNPFTKVSEEEWLAAALALDARLPGVPSDQHFIIALKQLVALLGDSHTLVGPPPRVGFRGFPINIHIFSDGPVVVAATREHADLLGRRLVRIGDVPFETVAAAVATTFAADNDSWRKVQLANWINVAELLHALSIIPDPDSAAFTFAGPDGAERTVELAAGIPAGAAWVFHPDPRRDPLPISRQARPGNYWFEFLPEQKVMYINYLRCADDPNRPFAAFVGELFGAIDSNPVERIVVDLRQNSGGDSRIIRPLIDGIVEREPLSARGRLFVLIGRRTFSSGQKNAQEFRARTGAVLDGEPTGQKPNAFGEIKVLILPGTGAIVQYSTRYFKTVDGDPPSMTPDILVEPVAADHFEGRDPVFDAAASFRPGGE